MLQGLIILLLLCLTYEVQDCRESKIANLSFCVSAQKVDCTFVLKRASADRIGKLSNVHQAEIFIGMLSDG